MEPYFLLSLSAIGALLLIGITLLINALKDVRSELGKIADDQADHAERLARIETTLTGVDGKNGINGEVKYLRRRLDDFDGMVRRAGGELIPRLTQ